MSAYLYDIWLGGGVKRRGSRRCLFGIPDREYLNQALEIQEQTLEREHSDTKRFTERWGFDPVAGIPVDGAQYVCSAVDCSEESVPEFYTKEYTSLKSKPAVRTRESWRGPYNDTIFKPLNLDTPLVHPRTSLKRRLQFESEVDDQENKTVALSSMYSSLRVPSPQPREDDSDMCGSSSVPSSSNNPCQSFLSCSNLPTSKNNTPTSLKQWSTSRSILPDLSSSKRFRGSGMPSLLLDLSTPRSMDAAQHTPQRQTRMKDFFPIQKMRCSKS